MIKLNPDRFVWDQSKKLRQQKELTLLASMIFLEARGESKQGKIAVGYVVINRYRNRYRWPHTISGVILQPYQFSCFNSHNIYSKAFMPPKKVWEECFESAIIVYSEDEEDPTNGANHYFNPDIVRPSWRTKMDFCIKIGNHEFYKD